MACSAARSGEVSYGRELAQGVAAATRWDEERDFDQAIFFAPYLRLEVPCRLTTGWPLSEKVCPARGGATCQSSLCNLKAGERS